jgi:hypothetical protein
MFLFVYVDISQYLSVVFHFYIFDSFLTSLTDEFQKASSMHIFPR